MMNTRSITKISLAALAITTLALYGPVEAGTLTVVSLPGTGTDAASGISLSKTYTHVLDFGSTTTAVSVNGVGFTQASAFSGTGYSYAATTAPGSTATGDFNFANLESGVADGGMLSLLSDIFYLSAAANGSESTLTLTGLTSGLDYSMRMYYAPSNWSASRSNTVTFNGDGSDESLVVLQDATGSGANYLQYDYTASGTSVTFKAVGADGADHWHLHAVTNEVAAVPEPETLASLGSGLIGLIWYGRRKRRASRK